VITTVWSARKIEIKMTIIRTLAAHDIVQAVYPRPITESDKLGIAVGRAIDGALSRYGYETSQNFRPTVSRMNKMAVELLDREIEEADIELQAGEHEKIQGQLSGVLQAYRHSEIFGLSRPRTRMILINKQVGIYAQPDYWDEKTRFYEMKSYKALPHPPDVDLQLKIFQLAYPGFQAILLCINRHATPVETITEKIAAMTEEGVKETLSMIYKIGLEQGKDKVLEYVDNPIVTYSIGP
jgi:hypothetical protein